MGFPFQVGIVQSFHVVCILSCVLSLKLNDPLHVIEAVLPSLTQSTCSLNSAEQEKVATIEMKVGGTGKRFLSPSFSKDPLLHATVLRAWSPDLLQGARTIGGREGNPVLVTVFLCSLSFSDLQN